MQRIYIILGLVSLLLVTDSGIAKQSNTSDFGLWQRSCNDANQCMLTQKVTYSHEGTSHVVAGATVSKTRMGIILTLRVPPMANAKHGLGMKIDDHSAFRVPLKQCDSNVCESNIAVDSILLAQMQQGQVMAVAYFDINDKQITLPVYLQGFADALSTI